VSLGLVLWHDVNVLWIALKKFSFYYLIPKDPLLVFFMFLEELKDLYFKTLQIRNLQKMTNFVVS
jgi:hypothetical protein